ncbi:carbonic anhydrase [Legionella londiniensis]|uniref:Carbonic anhydrase n=1 Tax=Legionella londiniensis TaxID=45068 RepID=A0A0W0VPB4_9GAMM|nr:carbonic anhydrase [Legionella londiniensis]KTD21593.1 carbonic anhydrase [Legionella londiniensis]STX93364.1 carbonic anhydrase [Legionella londiniensis]
MRNAASGALAFQKNEFKKRQALFQQLNKQQDPSVLFITCSDSRIDPNLITQSEPGELFVIRNAGNIIPPFNGNQASGEAATIEYALTVLNVREIIVCGHSQCGAMQGLINPESLEHLPSVKSWLRHSEKARMGLNKHSTQVEQLADAIKTNVLAQIDHLKTYPIVQQKISMEKLSVQGWVYDIKSGNISAYDAAKEEFLPLKKAMRNDVERSEARMKLPAIARAEAEIFLSKLIKCANLRDFCHTLQLASLTTQDAQRFIWHQIKETVAMRLYAEYAHLFKSANHETFLDLLKIGENTQFRTIGVSQKSMQSSEGYRQYCSRILAQEGLFASKTQKTIETPREHTAHHKPLF